MNDNSVNIHDAKTHLSRLVERVTEGREIIIARAGKPVAKLVPVVGTKRRRKMGALKGRFTVPDDFDTPLPRKVIADFEGR
ncbi:MAG TPA: type II toxin-antitoxin system Phd/YefM family antitoxin [Casimicrobiaceae bacterium]|nr:type II toxin-antitoxin system Phd/YefM family antitoxin [Casimicrobiaceae bacterium]